jgi:ubiquinone/menaquinone biosynthesis C-methylase UbiE
MTTENVDPVVKEYAAQARHYDETWFFYVQATTRETLKRLPMRRDSTVLDVGCGTGELLRRLREGYPDAVLAGIDPVPEMLSVARQKLRGKEELRVGYADALPWPEDTFDVVVSCNMFHYIAHPVAAVQEMGRVLRPAGALVITDWCDDYLACRLCNFYLRLTNRAFCKTYRHQECVALLHAAGHDDVHIERYKINWLWGLMTAVVQKPGRQVPGRT